MSNEAYPSIFNMCDCLSTRGSLTINKIRAIPTFFYYLRINPSGIVKYATSLSILISFVTLCTVCIS